MSDPAVVEFLGRRINLVFLLVAMILFSVAWPTLPLTHSLLVVLMPVAAGLAAFPVALAWARPDLGLAISLVSAAVLGVVVPRVDGWEWRITVVHVIAIVVLAGMTSLRGTLRLLPLSWVGVCVVFAISAPPGARAGWIAGMTVLFVVCGLLRVVVRSRRDLAHESAMKEVADARTAVLADRARIARDLHDVVAHRMSVVVVAAQTARYRVEGIGPEADAELQSIAGMAREALDEVRQLLGVLRVDGETAPPAPAPGVDDIGALVDATRAAGVVVEYHCDVDGPDVVSEGVAVATYRIVQEGLANAVRHAPGAPITVSLTGGSDGLVVRIVNRTTHPHDDTGSVAGGHGIPGMTERARAVGGSASIGPRGPLHDGEPTEFVVEASLPARGRRVAALPVGRGPADEHVR
ncbi:sensor histidine kinase [Williamsia deligens]|uniref:histidine kinase n=1 Tax=Williamsia deligens TaxID=321325 RepID=A0ABW3G0I7_9NOCA|nr:sensor histidine kinase [Williamsia deligens]MCP2195044.1 Signal transduction histidine kinase [Williamsia deligens]